ncbi:hypothetical protein BGV56_00735 [Burkholderia ubonensis]|uniref:hypothetical protein n=1 Tax=Burkholderia ubonensis TaxID=101571 RepID=UPI0007C648FE|nr:hypothetical protein [Burkholderia ubonensis]OJB40353.1 hypothetical protein BGV56_00735 [Burkholderia ubonensis]
MDTNEQETKAPDNDEVWTPAQLGRFLGYKAETIRSYSTQHPDRLPPRIAGLKRPRWLRSVAMEWARDGSKRAHIDAVPPPPPPREPRKPQIGRPRKTPAH